MPEVSGLTLMMAIQAVEAELHRLEAELTAAGEDADPDLQEFTLSYWKAARELKEAYLQAFAEASNLPPYEQLVARFRSEPPSK